MAAPHGPLSTAHQRGQSSARCCRPPAQNLDAMKGRLLRRLPRGVGQRPGPGSPPGYLPCRLLPLAALVPHIGMPACGPGLVPRLLRPALSRLRGCGRLRGRARTRRVERPPGRLPPLPFGGAPPSFAGYRFAHLRCPRCRSGASPSGQAPFPGVGRACRRSGGVRAPSATPPPVPGRGASGAPPLAFVRRFAPLPGARPGAAAPGLRVASRPREPGLCAPAGLLGVPWGHFPPASPPVLGKTLGLPWG